MPTPIPNPDLRAQHALAPLVESAAELVSEDDLVRIADQLAREFDYNPYAAQAAERRWYQDRTAPKVCSSENAALLKNMTVYRALAHGTPAEEISAAVDAEFDERLGHVDDDPQPLPAHLNFSKLPNRVGMPLPRMSGQEQDAEELADFLNRTPVPAYLAFSAGVVSTLIALAALTLFARLG